MNPPGSEPRSTFEMLRSLALFEQLSDEALHDLEHELQWFALPGGALLFESGDPSDALYVLKSGSVGAFRANANGQQQLVGVVAAGETVGEVGLIIDRPRSATVRALRDSELLRLSRDGFDKLVAHHPRSMLEMARISVRRLATMDRSGRASMPRTFAIIGHDATVAIREFAEQLVAALERFGDCALIDDATGRGQLSNWFSALEASSRFVVYLANSDVEWQSLCVRQADCLLLIANADDTPQRWHTSACSDASSALARPRHLVLLHRDGIKPGSARRWLELTPGSKHHHVRHASDVKRVARLLTGNSLGLVLSGGGARGFAQIGVVRALREAGMEIDCVGGTSIGAIIGAGVAMDWSYEELYERYHYSFVQSRPLGDYTLPLVALTRGQRVARLLREQFNDCDMTDLVLPYFCCSTNLSEGVLAVHEQGPLWLWLRASCSIPGVLPPVSHYGQIFVDGAVMNNLPTDIMRARQPGAMVAVDIGADDALRALVEEHSTPSWWRMLLDLVHGRRPGIFDILIRSGMVNAELASAERRRLATLLISPPVRDISLLDWKAYDRAIASGYQDTLRAIGSDRDWSLDEMPIAL
jgi:NTE family protein